MQGRRAPRPPLGWEPGQEPTPSWRKLKEGRAPLVFDADRPPPALQFLRSARAQWAPGAPESSVEAPEPGPARKSHRAPRLGRSGAVYERSSDATAAARQRLHRERARDGRRIVPVAIDGEAEELLRASGVLPEWDADSREAVGHAVERLIELLVLADRHA
jgi:hypothetical protein